MATGAHTDGSAGQDGRDGDPAETLRREVITVADGRRFDAVAAGDPEAAATRGRGLVLVLHGFPQTGESMRDLLPPLAEAGYLAVAPWQRGYSRAVRPDGVEPYRLSHIAADAVAVAEALGADTFHVVGHDWGGGVAWGLAARAAARLRTATSLSTPHPDALSQSVRGVREAQRYRSLYADFFRVPGSERLMLSAGPGLFARMLRNSGMPGEHAGQIASLLRRPEDLGRALNWYRANPFNGLEELGPVSVPFLFIRGGADPFLGAGPAETSSYLAAGPYRYVELPGKGHWLPERNAGDVVPLILDHLQRFGG